MTRTMTIKHDSPRTRNPLGYITPQASIPSFMESSFGACSVLQREKSSLEYTERWIKHNAYPTNQQGATPMEVDAYLNCHGIDLADVPEPIDIHSAEEWEGMGMDDGDPHILSLEELQHLIA